MPTPANTGHDAEPTGSGNRRTAARVAAVQALYQIDVTDLSVDAVLAEFTSYRLPRRTRVASTFGAPDRTHFLDVVRGAIVQAADIDRMIESAMAEGWTLERMDRVLYATVRAGAYELASRSDVPARVVISEYVDVARAFFDGREPAFVNGMLDGLARLLRPAEFAASGSDGKPASA